LSLRSAVLGAMHTATTVSTNEFTVEILRFGLSHLLEVGEAVVRQEVEHYLGTGHHHLLYAGKGADLAVLAVTSGEHDRVLTYIYKQLKHAAEQFSRRRPALIWTYIEGIEPQEWHGLLGDTGLQRMSNRYMLGQGRQHVMSMAYSSAGELVAHGHGHSLHSGPLMHYGRQGSESEKLARMLFGWAAPPLRGGDSVRLQWSESS
jgi:hypothetical protein